jgi:hypothetical protein
MPELDCDIDLVRCVCGVIHESEGGGIFHGGSDGHFIPMGCNTSYTEGYFATAYVELRAADSGLESGDIYQ